MPRSADCEQLNALGYGRDETGLVLNLVYNPQGPSLPPPQDALEADYKRVLGERYGVVFNRLYTLANMPIQRFGAILIAKGEFDRYLDLLQHAHRDANLDGVMCRNLDLGRLAGLRLRLRLQPDARPAARRMAGASACICPTCSTPTSTASRSGSPATATAAPPAKARAAAARSRKRRSEPSAPGAMCPADYRYAPSAFDRAAGYRRGPALCRRRSLRQSCRARRGRATRRRGRRADRLQRRLSLVRCGKADGLPRSMHASRAILPFAAMWRLKLRAPPTSAPGCGCAYPASVAEDVVRRSNEILIDLRRTAATLPGASARLAALPMHLVAEVGGARVGIVHGDATALAGWTFAHEALDDPAAAAALNAVRRTAPASTCSPRPIPALPSCAISSCAPAA